MPRREPRLKGFWIIPKNQFSKDFYDMEVISFKPEWRSEVSLKQISESRYELDGNFSTYRLITEETGNIIAVDPEGGPMISVGDLIRDNNIVNIVSEITLQDDRIILTLIMLLECPAHLTERLI